MKVYLCACFRNEAEHLLEWLAYHAVIGIDHVVLYNDRSDDAWRDAITIAPSSWMTLREARHSKITPSLQQDIYHDFLQEFGADCDFVAFIDIDEYLCFAVPLHRHLALMEPNVGQVRMSWLNFGSSGHLQRDASRLTIERFTRCSYGHYNHQITKSLVRPCAVRSVGIHSHALKAPYVSVDAAGNAIQKWNHTRITAAMYGPLFLAHYAVRSREEFVRKQQRGYNNPQMDQPDVIHEGYFRAYNQNAHVCTRLSEMAFLVRKQLARWKQAWRAGQADAGTALAAVAGSAGEVSGDRTGSEAQPDKAEAAA